MSINFSMDGIHTNVLSPDSLNSHTRIPCGGWVCCGIGGELSRSVDHPTLCCLLWLGDNGPLLWGETGNLNLTQEALKATQNKLLSSGISPY